MDAGDFPICHANITSSYPSAICFGHCFITIFLCVVTGTTGNEAMCGHPNFIEFDLPFSVLTSPEGCLRACTVFFYIFFLFFSTRVKYFEFVVEQYIKKV